MMMKSKNVYFIQANVNKAEILNISMKLYFFVIPMQIRTAISCAGQESYPLDNRDLWEYANFYYFANFDFNFLQ